ncbi:Cytokinin dehydrogenase 1, FAD and cytokinin binding [Sinosporangium album]|uniref:Cytokinin dehydrogenase 1, FAD and cytokinin binding n=1 Tax=Sinosporangium album TaxID=504805 RepID=A0A1G8B7L2_9ACTN|nr:FAD-binding protein [Sinosporangium album]SDH28620.1 Cytokinin dehydrogenase 1, FAD and cytokinin binding [Sinosporangium album]
MSKESTGSTEVTGLADEFPGSAGLSGLPGELLLDAESLAAAADDFGHITHHLPAAVLRPGSGADVAHALRFAASACIPARARGAGHSTQGQGQVAGGLVLDLTVLRKIHDVGADSVTVDGGALWSHVLAATLPRGLTPPVLTDYLEITVGGTLSVGGVGGATHRHGAQTDHVLRLDVASADGTVTSCGPDHKADLFHAVLAGRGGHGVIVRAVLRLVPAPTRARRFQLVYPDLATLAADQSRLIAEGAFDHVEGQIVPGPTGWTYRLEAAAYHGPGEPPGDAVLLAGLHHLPGAVGEEIEDLAYGDFLNRMAAGEAYLRQTGEWHHPHPWLNAFLPGADAVRLASDLLADFTPADLGPSGVILFYPVSTARFATPGLALPDDPEAFLLSLLRTSPPDDPDAITHALAQNRAIADRIQSAGGTLYLSDPT